MIKSEYNKEEGIIYVERVGEITAEDIIEYINITYKRFDSHQSLYIIDDFRPSNSLFDKDSYPKMLDAIKVYINNYSIVRYAAIVDNPQDTVRTVLFELLSNSIENFTFKTFSTIQAAKDWIR